MILLDQLIRFQYQSFFLEVPYIIDQISRRSAFLNALECLVDNPDLTWFSFETSYYNVRHFEPSHDLDIQYKMNYMLLTSEFAFWGENLHDSGQISRDRSSWSWPNIQKLVFNVLARVSPVSSERQRNRDRKMIKRVVVGKDRIQVCLLANQITSHPIFKLIV